MSVSSRKVHLCFSPETKEACDRLPSNIGRSSLIDSLIKSFDLHKKCNLVRVVPASSSELCVFHDETYVQELLKDREEDNGEEDVSLASNPKFGLEFDCPPFSGLKEYASHVVGSSLSAANELLSPKKNKDVQNIAVNWYGGRHHASKLSASGFCYVNDIVLAIMRLRSQYKKIFYFDADLHHGDGVESAFRFSKNVATFSVHRYGVGFFPGTGGTSIKGAYNFPTQRGLSDENFQKIVEEAVIPKIQVFQPDVIVLQCGSDGLAGDPNGEWNLSIRRFSETLLSIVESFENTDFLVLGGGGYNHTETAKFCAWFLKSLVKDTSEWSDIPEHPLMDSYESDAFQFWTSDNQKGKSGRRDENKDVEGLIEESRRT